MKSLFRLLAASMALLSSLFGGNANAAVTSVVLDSNQSLSVNLGLSSSVWLSVTVVDVPLSRYSAPDLICWFLSQVTSLGEHYCGYLGHLVLAKRE